MSWQPPSPTQPAPPQSAGYPAPPGWGNPAPAPAGWGYPANASTPVTGPKNVFTLAMSIALIVVSVLRIQSIVSLAGLLHRSDFNQNMITADIALNVVVCLSFVVTGLLGLAWAARPPSAGILIALGWVTIAVALIEAAAYSATFQMSVLYIVSAIVGTCIEPVLFVVAALNLKKQAVAQR